MSWIFRKNRLVNPQDVIVANLYGHNRNPNTRNSLWTYFKHFWTNLNFSEQSKEYNWGNFINMFASKNYSQGPVLMYTAEKFNEVSICLNIFGKNSIFRGKIDLTRSKDAESWKGPTCTLKELKLRSIATEKLNFENAAIFSERLGEFRFRQYPMKWPFSCHLSLR